MSSKKLQLDSYRKALLNRVTANAAFMEYIQNSLTREEEMAKHSFHKIMVHNWSGTDIQLFDTLSEYFTSTIIPIMYISQGDITSFYTSSLSFILNIIKLDFMFPFQRNMFNIDILFNDKSSVECFDSAVTVEDIICGVISRRFSSTCELDLSNLCSDPEFLEKNICFYKMSLITYFKILMLRMGRDTKSLNLSNNNLSQTPVEILNFFIKGDLTAINLSNNNIPSLSEILRVSSKIEKLWIEGNPLCEDLNPVNYVKNVTMKFPRLIELDGVKLNQDGLLLPVIKNYLATPNLRTRMVVEKFLIAYFSHYDRSNRKKIINFYDNNAVLTFTEYGTNIDATAYKYSNFARNILNPEHKTLFLQNRKCYTTNIKLLSTLCQFPNTIHDPHTFHVDVLLHNNKSMVLVVDGIFKTINNDNNTPEYYYQFRRTFIFNIKTKKAMSLYTITNEMFTLRAATKEQIENSFLHPVRNATELALIDPDDEESNAILQTFMHLTQLIKSEAEARLRIQNWDIKKAIILFMTEMKENKISPEKFIEEDDFSDLDSLMDNDID